MPERPEKFCSKCEFDCCKIRTNCQGDQKCYKVGKTDCCQERSCCVDGKFESTCCGDKMIRGVDKPSCCKVGKSDCCQEKSCCKDVKCVDRKICEDGEGNFYCKCERTCEIKVNREENKPSCCKVGKSDCCQEKSCCKDVKCVDRKICEDGEGNFYCKCERTCEIKVNRGEDKPSCCKVGKSDCCQKKSCCKDVKCVDRKICEDGEGNFYCKCERTCEIKVNRGEEKPSCCKVGKSDCCQEKSCCKDVKCVDRKICRDAKGNFYCKCERTCEIKVNREEDQPSCCEVGKSECFKEKSCCKDCYGCNY